MTNKLVNTLNTLVDYILLNVLWVIASLPLITFFPATAALFGVVRKHQLMKENDGIVRDYIRMFKDNCKQSILISLVWGLVGLLLFVNYTIIQPEQSWDQLLLSIALWVALVLFVSMSAYLFPIMVHFQLSWKHVIKNAFFLTLMNPVLSLLLVALLSVSAYILYVAPVSIFIIGSFFAYATYYLCQVSFNQVMAGQER